ncbi:MAG: polyprenyl synthetase family protein [Actinobacteria bacterium]|nr:polyprenyl synthetase family protein [Actinomycetota bacterium]
MQGGATTSSADEADARQVARWIEQERRSAPFVDATELSDVVDYVLKTQGGFLRGRLVLAIEDGARKQRLDYIRNAVCAVEMLHLASLVHDDVIDSGVVRRGEQAVGTRFGQTMASFVGGWLCLRASELIASCGKSALSDFVTSADRMCRGGMLEMRDLFNVDRTAEECLTAARLKTGSTFELAARLGALAGNASETEIAKVAKFGSRLGTAYQVWDDASDLVAPIADPNKAPMSDLRQGLYNLAVVYAIEEQPDIRIRLENPNRSLQDYDAVVEAIKKTSALTRARDVADELVRRSLDEVSDLPMAAALNALVEATRMRHPGTG